MSLKVCKYTGVFKKRMLAVIKKQRDATNFTLYGIFLLIVILVMNIFRHSVAPLKVVDQFFGINQNAPFNFLAFKIFAAFPTSKASFKKRLNALTSFLTSKIFKAVQKHIFK